MAEICAPISSLMVPSSFKQIIIRTPVISFKRDHFCIHLFQIQDVAGNSLWKFCIKKIPCHEVKNVIKSVLSSSVMLASNNLQCQFGVLVPRMPAWLALDCPSLQKLQSGTLPVTRHNHSTAVEVATVTTVKKE